MTSRIQVSNLQLFMAVIAAVVAYGHFVYVGLSFRAAGRDAWLSLIVGFCISSMIFYFRVKQATLHPDKSLIEYTLHVFGKWIGSLLSMVYIAFFLTIAAFALKEVTNFLGIMYPATPVMVFLLIELLLVCWVARAGGEVMTRVIQLLLPILIILGILAAVLSVKDKDPRKLLPIMDHSMFSIWHGSLMFIVIFSELIVFSMFWKDAADLQKTPRQVWWTTLILFLMFIGPVTGPIMIFGERLTQLLPYPTYAEIQYISLTGIFERMDVVAVLLWTMGSYIRISVFVVGALRATAHLLGAEQENLYAIPLTVLLGGMTMTLISTSRETLHQFLYTTYPLVAVVVGVGIPLLTAIVAWMRGRWRTESQPA